MLSVIFDIDDTLYHRQDPFVLAFDKVFPGHEELPRSAMFQDFLKHGNALFEDSMSGRIPMEEMYILRIQRALAEYGMYIKNEEALAFQDAYLWEQEHLRLKPFVRDILEFCKQAGAFLAVITNGPSEHQRVKFHALGLDRWIPEEAVLASGDIGINKPDVRIFKEAAKRWHLNPKETWYVGDSYRHDIVSAKDAGWHALWLDRSGQTPQVKAPAADRIVYSEEQLLKCLRKLFRQEN